MSDEQAQPGVSAARANRRNFVIISLLLVMAVAALTYWLLTRNRVSTDDAQIDGNLVPISPRVSGYVDLIAVADNQYVEARQLLVQLDRRDLEAALRRAEADLASARAQQAAAAGQVAIVERTAPAGERQAGAAVTVANAGVAASDRQVASAEAQVRSAEAGVEAAREAVESARSDVAAAEAQIDAAQAAVRQAESNVTSAAAQANRTAADEARARQLFAGGAIPKQQLDAVAAANTSAQAALDAARDAVASARAALAHARTRRASAEAAVRQANARLASAADAVEQARAGVGVARADLAQARGQLNQARAAEAGAQTAPQQISAGKAQAKAAAARVRQAAAALRAARLQLSYTQITAPVAGVVSQKGVEPGQFVQPGQLLMSIVPLSNVWITANFKETQIGRMRPGQPAMIRVDSCPGRRFHGRIQSIGAATGAKFSLLPPQNATGNFVKVVQRIPVKIVFDQPIPKGIVLRPGQNVIATVYL